MINLIVAAKMCRFLMRGGCRCFLLCTAWSRLLHSVCGFSAINEGNHFMRRESSAQMLSSSSTHKKPAAMIQLEVQKGLDGAMNFQDANGSSQTVGELRRATSGVRPHVRPERRAAPLLQKSPSPKTKAEKAEKAHVIGARTKSASPKTEAGKFDRRNSEIAMWQRITHDVEEKVHEVKAANGSPDAVIDAAADAAEMAAIDAGKEPKEVGRIVADVERELGGDPIQAASDFTSKAIIEEGTFPRTADSCAHVAKEAADAAMVEGGSLKEAFRAAGRGAALSCIAAAVSAEELVNAVEDAVRQMGGSDDEAHEAAAEAGRLAAADAANAEASQGAPIEMQAQRAGDAVRRVALAMNKPPLEIAKAVKSAALEAGASHVMMIKIVGEACAEAAIQLEKSIGEVASDTMTAIQFAGGSEIEVCDALIRAVAKAGFVSHISSLEIGALARDAALDAGCSSEAACYAAGEAAADALIKNNSDPQAVAAAAADATAEAVHKLHPHDSIEIAPWHVGGRAAMRASTDAGTYSIEEIVQLVAIAVKEHGGSDRNVTWMAGESAEYASMAFEDIPDNVAEASFRAVITIGGTIVEAKAAARKSFVTAATKAGAFATKSKLEKAADESVRKAETRSAKHGIGKGKGKGQGAEHLVEETAEDSEKDEQAVTIPTGARPDWTA